jgi:hypothetical protein
MFLAQAVLEMMIEVPDLLVFAVLIGCFFQFLSPQQDPKPKAA